MGANVSNFEQQHRCNAQLYIMYIMSSSPFMSRFELHLPRVDVFSVLHRGRVPVMVLPLHHRHPPRLRPLRVRGNRRGGGQPRHCWDVSPLPPGDQPGPRVQWDRNRVQLRLCEWTILHLSPATKLFRPG